MSLDDTEVFQFKYNHLLNSLDDDVLLEVLKAKRLETYLKIGLYGNKHPNNIDVIPGYIIHDSTYGRQYLYCLELEKKLPRILRLDKINSAQCGEVLNTSDCNKAAKMSTYSDDCWCTSGVEQKIDKIVIEFR